MSFSGHVLFYYYQYTSTTKTISGHLHLTPEGPANAVYIYFFTIPLYDNMNYKATHSREKSETAFSQLKFFTAFYCLVLFCFFT